VMTMSGEEFIGRFLMHVLPEDFVRIRHYGLLANGKKKANLERSRELIGETEIKEVEECEEAEEGVKERAEEICSLCGIGRLIRSKEIKAGSDPPESISRLEQAA